MFNLVSNTYVKINKNIILGYLYNIMNVMIYSSRVYNYLFELQHHSSTVIPLCMVARANTAIFFQSLYSIDIYISSNNFNQININNPKHINIKILF